MRYSKDEQSKLDRKAWEHHLNEDADGVGGAAQSTCALIGQCVLTGERQSSRAHPCKYPVSTQCGTLKCYKSPGKVSATFSEGSDNERGKWKLTGIY